MSCYGEDSPRGQGFLAELCGEWEAATGAASDAGVRTAIVRMGVVLGKGGGALAKMLLPFKLGVGGPLGNGRQWMSWIHIDDLTSLFVFLLEHPTPPASSTGRRRTPSRCGSSRAASAARCTARRSCPSRRRSCGSRSAKSPTCC